MVNKQKLAEFLVKAKKATYASGDDKRSVKEKDFSTTLVFEDGKYKYHDNYFGGEPFGGREVVFFENKPIYMMVYYGFVEKEVKNIQEIYKFLQNSLKLVSKDSPFRWPKNYKEGDLTYENNFSWEMSNFKWTEKIYLNWKKLYEASYMWGFVDL